DTRLISTIVGLATASLLCVDLLFGQPLLRQSVLSYDAITGIRFYGLGNESSGVLLGATLLGLYALLDHSAFFRRNILWTVVLPYILVFVLVGAPSFGSDFGGMFAALAGFGYALLKARSDRKWRRNMIWTAVVGVILLGVLIATNINLDASKQTHIGRAFHDAMQQGPSIIVDLAVRKWSMNIRLIRSSLWTYALLSLLISLVILFYRPVGIIKGTLRKHPLLNAGFKGIIIGMVVALLTNDSGIAMAATGLLYLAIPLILMVMDVVSARAAGEAVDQQRVGSEASCS
ncbi:MAG TPA: hypothetical protein VHV83_09860, partial [Armatimonadota bacterium]|nr:hypothetical protein [Armatimonadota bacterium]